MAYSPLCNLTVWLMKVVQMSTMRQKTTMTWNRSRPSVSS